MSRLKEIINQRSMIKNLYKRTGICPTLLAVLSPQMIKKLHALSYCSNARRKMHKKMLFLKRLFLCHF